jgi:hypothetical protein
MKRPSGVFRILQDAGAALKQKKPRQQRLPGLLLSVSQSVATAQVDQLRCTLGA